MGWMPVRHSPTNPGTSSWGVCRISTSTCGILTLSFRLLSVCLPYVLTIAVLDSKRLYTTEAASGLCITCLLSLELERRKHCSKQMSHVIFSGNSPVTTPLTHTFTGKNSLVKIEYRSVFRLVVFHEDECTDCSIGATNPARHVLLSTNHCRWTPRKHAVAIHSGGGLPCEQYSVTAMYYVR